MGKGLYRSAKKESKGVTKMAKKSKKKGKK